MMGSGSIGEMVVRIVGDNKEFDKAIDGSQKKAEGFEKTIKDIVTGLGLVALANQMKALGQAALTASGEMEQQTVAFDVMLGSAEKSQKLLKEMKRFADTTPFTFGDMTQGAKTMIQYGVATESIMPLMKQLGDIAMGNSGKLAGLTYAFGQITGAGRLMGQDLLQLINHGFNPLKEISRTTGESMASLREKMGKAQISVDMVMESFKTATSVGGTFYQGTEKLGQSFQGLQSTLLDANESLKRGFGDVMLPIMKELTKLQTNFVVELSQMSDSSKKTILIIGGLTTALITATAAVIGINAALAAVGLTVSMIAPYIALGAAVMSLSGILLNSAISASDAESRYRDFGKTLSTTEVYAGRYRDTLSELSRTARGFAAEVVHLDTPFDSFARKFNAFVDVAAGVITANAFGDLTEGMNELTGATNSYNSAIRDALVLGAQVARDSKQRILDNEKKDASAIAKAAAEVAAKAAADTNKRLDEEKAKREAVIDAMQKTAEAADALSGADAQKYGEPYSVTIEKNAIAQKKASDELIVSMGEQNAAQIESLRIGAELVALKEKQHNEEAVRAYEENLVVESTNDSIRITNEVLAEQKVARDKINDTYNEQEQYLAEVESSHARARKDAADTARINETAINSLQEENDANILGLRIGTELVAIKEKTLAQSKAELDTREAIEVTNQVIAESEEKRLRASQAYLSGGLKKEFKSTAEQIDSINKRLKEMAYLGSSSILLDPISQKQEEQRQALNRTKQALIESLAETIRLASAEETLGIQSRYLTEDEILKKAALDDLSVATANYKSDIAKLNSDVALGLVDERNKKEVLLTVNRNYISSLQGIQQAYAGINLPTLNAQLQAQVNICNAINTALTGVQVTSIATMEGVATAAGEIPSELQDMYSGIVAENILTMTGMADAIYTSQDAVEARVVQSSQEMASENLKALTETEAGIKKIKDAEYADFASIDAAKRLLVKKFGEDEVKATEWANNEKFKLVIKYGANVASEAGTLISSLKTIYDMDTRNKVAAIDAQMAKELQANTDAHNSELLKAGFAVTTADTKVAQAQRAYDKAVQSADEEEIRVTKLALDRAIIDQKYEDRANQIRKDAMKEKYRVELEAFENGKKFQIAQTIIETAAMAAKAFSSLVGTPFVGPVLGAAAAVAAGALGAAKIKMIQDQSPPPPPSFAEGGIVMPQIGGTLARVAEAGQPEAIFPLDKLERFLSKGGVSNTGSAPMYGGDGTIRLVVNLDSKPFLSTIFPATKNKTVLISSGAVV